MLGAQSHGVAGILGECGGQAMCATCHVYVDAKDLDLLPPMSDDEDAMLEDTASERKPTSRLSCQIDACDELDGIIVHLPDEQALRARAALSSSARATPGSPYAPRFGRWAGTASSPWSTPTRCCPTSARR
jgi:2Fe-2S ferredoxin